jgi:hypothetical protein
LETLAPYFALVPPSWLLALLLAALHVFLFRIFLGREGRSVFYFFPWGIAGFAAGNLIAVFASSPLPSLGDVHIVEASIGAWLLLTIANLRVLPD